MLCFKQESHISILSNKKGSRSCPFTRLLREKLHAVLLTELFDATGGVNDLLLARVKRMALGAHFNVQILAISRTCLEHIATTAGDVDFFVIRVGIGLHAH